MTSSRPHIRCPAHSGDIFTYESLAYDQPRGWLHVIWPDYRDGATEGVNILYSRSTDGGSTWSSAERLNDDPPNVVRDQWFPALAAAPDGRLSALWLDRREDPTNGVYRAYARSSTDGGLTWSPAAAVSSAPSDPNMAIPPNSDGMGDYIGIAAGPGVVWGAWTDVRNGNQDIYAAREQFTPTAYTNCATNLDQHTYKNSYKDLYAHMDGPCNSHTCRRDKHQHSHTHHNTGDQHGNRGNAHSHINSHRHAMHYLVQ